LESLLFFLNSIAVVVLVVMGLRDDRRKPGRPATSYFRYSEEEHTASDRVGVRLNQASRANRPNRGPKP